MYYSDGYLGGKVSHINNLRSTLTLTLTDEKRSSKRWASSPWLEQVLQAIKVAIVNFTVPAFEKNIFSIQNSHFGMRILIFQCNRQKIQSVFKCFTDQLHQEINAILKAINRVWMFHGVVCLSDITTSDSSRINEEFLCNRDQFDGRRNDFLWPVKHDGNKSDWLEWRKFMEFVYSCCLSGCTSGSNRHHGALVYS